MSKKALIVIDMQKVSFTPATPRFDTDEVVERINSLSAKFRTAGAPVIIIQHNGTKENECVPETTEWELLDDLNVEATDFIIPKIANDSFYRSKLHETLSALNVDELVITGCATDFCVESTVQSGLAKDYSIIVVGDAHTTADRPHLDAKQIIDHYNWTWINMIPTKGILRVIDTKFMMKMSKERLLGN
jgi:nicotinamidase-related amidase